MPSHSIKAKQRDAKNTRPLAKVAGAQYLPKAKQRDTKNPSLLAKVALAQYVLEMHVKPNMRIALGSGSTAEEFIKALAKIPEKQPKLCIASSRKSFALAQKLGLPVVTEASLDHVGVELCIDGADEIDAQLRLIKGGGGCLLREKILAQSSQKMIVIAEKTKLKKQLGHFPLPLEIDRFAHHLARRQVVELFEDVMKRKGTAKIRGGEKTSVLTDGGNITLDCAWGEWHENAAVQLAEELNKIPGVIENGIFEREATLCLLASYSTKDNLGNIKITERNRQNASSENDSSTWKTVGGFALKHKSSTAQDAPQSNQKIVRKQLKNS